MARLEAGRDLRVVDLEAEAALARERVARADDAVPGAPDAHDGAERLLRGDLGRERLRRARRARDGRARRAQLPRRLAPERRALRELLLVALALRVREVRRLRAVHRAAQAALVRPEVVAHEVRVARQVDALQRQLPQPLPPVQRLHLVARHPAPARPAPVLSPKHPSFPSGKKKKKKSVTLFSQLAN